MFVIIVVSTVLRCVNDGGKFHAKVYFLYRRNKFQFGISDAMMQFRKSRLFNESEMDIFCEANNRAQQWKKTTKSFGPGADTVKLKIWKMEMRRNSRGHDADRDASTRWRDASRRASRRNGWGTNGTSLVCWTPLDTP